MDEDDREFEKYVDHNVEWDGVIEKGKNVQTDDRMDGVVEEGDADSDDFESEKETSDKGSVPKLTKYNPKTDNKSPNLKLGLVFRSKKEAKEVIETYSLRRGMIIKFVFNDKRRLKAVCKKDGCEWSKEREVSKSSTVHTPIIVRGGVNYITMPNLRAAISGETSKGALKERVTKNDKA
ncbi:hypothetical protein DH2020_027587 [Rehmannia glutinosa]|uniref:Transposase MuDR plant domain-containing protein n=1 Tax=Rehmannia glutinosa TaxID=99300 RepID=A0ABR0VXM1_REHGL